MGETGSASRLDVTVSLNIGQSPFQSYSISSPTNHSRLSYVFGRRSREFGFPTRPNCHHVRYLIPEEGSRAPAAADGTVPMVLNKQCVDVMIRARVS